MERGFGNVIGGNRRRWLRFSILIPVVLGVVRPILLLRLHVLFRVPNIGGGGKRPFIMLIYIF